MYFEHLNERCHHTCIYCMFLNNSILSTILLIYSCKCTVSFIEVKHGVITKLDREFINQNFQIVFHALIFRHLIILYSHEKTPWLIRYSSNVHLTVVALYPSYFWYIDGSVTYYQPFIVVSIYREQIQKFWFLTYAHTYLNNGTLPQ